MKRNYVEKLFLLSINYAGQDMMLSERAGWMAYIYFVSLTWCFNNSNEWDVLRFYDDAIVVYTWYFQERI